jgi:transcriptional regulator with XRE-family HTH domain
MLIGEGLRMMSDLGDRIREERELAGLSVEQLAGRLGVDPAYLLRLERGGVALDLGVALRLRRALDDKPNSY